MIPITKTIGIAGTQSRIGTTTQALQLVQYLQLMGNKVCYLEMSNKDYIKNLLALYDIQEKEKGHVFFSGEHATVELYGMQYVRQLAKKDYDYIVKDYGAYDGETFNLASFLEQDCKIFVGGTKPNEIFKTFQVLREPEFDDISFLISFADNSKDIRAAIKGLFDSKDGKSRRSHKVYFAEYVPEPFEYIGVANKTYADLIRGEERGET